MLQTVAIRTPKHLCIKDNALVIREKKSSEVIGKIALSDIWVIIIDNPQVTMTSALMSGINKAGIGVLSDRQNQPFLCMAIALAVASVVIKPNSTAFFIHSKIAVIIISLQRKKLINIDFNLKDISNTLGNFPCGILPHVEPAHFHNSPVFRVVD